MNADYWKQPAVIARNNFKFKSLCDFSFNTAVGCIHGCRFCYVPEVATIKQTKPLAELGVADPDADWGNYVFVRNWDEKKFIASLKAAEKTPPNELSYDGHRAVMYCTTTDPYQVIGDKELRAAHQNIVRQSLELIRDHSTLNVRILTRSRLAKNDFELFKSFQNRLVFGMSLPTLNINLARIYEPHAPAPSQRLKTLQEAKASGLHVYVAIAPTYPECDEEDLRATISAVAALEPVTVFHEPINIRAENVERIRLHAATEGVAVNTDVFATPSAWRRYAIDQLKLVETIANELGVGDRLHLWPDQELISTQALGEVENPLEYYKWVRRWHSRVSEWPEHSSLANHRQEEI